MISKRWKLAITALPIIGTLAIAQPQPGGLGGFFSAWYGVGNPYNFDDTLLIQYLFNGNATDSSGNGHDIDVNSSVTFTNNNAYFPGGATTGYLRLYAFSEIQNYTNFSLSFWAKNVAWSDNFPRFTEKGQNNEWTLARNSGLSRRVNVQVNTSQALDTGIADTTNQWNHYVFTLSSSSNWTLYYNNVLEYTLVRTITANNTNDIFIGGNLPSFSTAVDYGGYIDNWRYYTKKLNVDEVNLLYNEGPPE